MLTYLLKRLLIFIPTLLVISLVAFGLDKIAPGDPIAGELQGGQEEGVEDYEYYELAYRSVAARLGLDRASFYFDFTAAAYPDTLYKILDRDKISNLKKLIGQYGNWEQVEAYNAQIRAMELALFSWPDSLAKNTHIQVKRTVGLLYYSYKEPRINSLLDKMKLAIASVEGEQIEQALAPVNRAMNDLDQKYRQVISEATPSKLYQPVFRWNGFDNQYHNWLVGFMKGDFGVSRFDSQPVTNKIKVAAWWTLMMNLLAIFFTFLLAIPLGVFAAQKQGSFFDRFSSFILFVFYSIPVFWLATLLVIFFTTPEYGLHYFASIGLGNLPKDADFWSRFWQRLSHLILPVFCITYGGLAFVSRQVRGGMLAVIRQDYIRTARAKGLKEGQVIWRHAFRNSLFPLITIFASIFPATLAGAVVVEVIFNIPGMGRLMFDSIYAKDWPVVITVLMLVAILTMIGNLVADFLFAAIDPRVSFRKTNVSR